MRFDASTVFVLVLTVVVILVIALMNVYGRDPKSVPAARESVKEPASGEPLNSNKGVKKTRRR